MPGPSRPLNPITSARTPRRIWRTFLPAGVLLVCAACDEETRCWEDGSCPDTSATHEEDATAVEADASSNGTNGDSVSSDAQAPTSERVSTEPRANTWGTQSSEGSTATSPTATSPSADSGDSTSAMAATPSSNSDVDAAHTGDSTSSEGSSEDSSETCTEDEQCPGQICVSGTCDVCDPSDHRGCESSETGNRCRQSEGGNACVACVPGDLPPEEGDPCGVNGRGTPTLECVAGVWQTTTCEDPDVCTDGETQVGSTTCGPNEDGRYLAECTGGQWVDDIDSCIDDDQCVNGTRRQSDTECGFSGYLEQQCVNGTWLTQSNRCIECQRSYRVPDPLFESSLSERNNIPANPVDPDSVKYMVTLDLSFSSISDATGIQCFTSLQELDLNKNQLSDLTPLASLTQLRSLSLAYNALYGSDLAPLGALTELRYLSLEAAAVTSLDGLEPLTLLEELRVPYNHIQDVTPLVPLTSLQSLSIYGNAYLACDSGAYTTLQSRIPEQLYSDCP